MRTFLLVAAATLAAACNPQTSNSGDAASAPPVPALAHGDLGAGVEPGSAAPPMADESAPAAAQTADTPAITLTTEDQKAIYALGAMSGRQIRIFDLSPEELDIYEAGLRAAQQGEPLLVENSYGPQLQQLARTRSAAAAASFLNRAAQEEGAVKTASGFVYKSLLEGSGASPERTDTVSVNYRGTMIDGREVDSSPAGQVRSFRPGDAIPCWTEALQMMKPGGKARLVCPPELAYGDAGLPSRGVSGPVTLIFEIELVAVKE
jgi:FKBP-type peptidyl-prolyl cis-trans isomerase FkpA